MDPPALLLLGGLDPTGQAGLARDLRVCAETRLHGCPVSTAWTVQGPSAVEAVNAVDADIVLHQMEAAARAFHLQALKAGVLASHRQIDIVARFVAAHPLPFVLDPVLRATDGLDFLQETSARILVQRLLPHATLVTPNLAEAQTLASLPKADADEAAAALVALGAQAALVTQGGQAADVLHDGTRLHHIPAALVPGRHRGTGCRLATRIACHLAHRMPLLDAVQAATLDLRRELAHDAQEQGLDGERLAHFRELEAWLPRILHEIDGAHVPEVGMNLAYAMPGADSGQDVLGLAGRIAIAGTGRAVAGRLAFGGPHHTGRLAVVLQEIAPTARLVLNHRHDPSFIEAARAAGLTESSFRRADEPPDAPSTMEWGLREAVRRHRDATGDPEAWPDLVWDEGGPGKEAMVRVLAADPAGLVDKLRAMHGQRLPPTTEPNPTPPRH